MSVNETLARWEPEKARVHPRLKGAELVAVFGLDGCLS
jgi:hypothetical protein